VSYDLYRMDPNSGNFNPILDTISLGNSLRAIASVAVGTLSVPEPKSFALLVIIRPLIMVLIAKGGSLATRAGSMIDPSSPTEPCRTSPQLRRARASVFRRREGNSLLIGKQKLAIGLITPEWPVTNERSPPVDRND